MTLQDKRKEILEKISVAPNFFLLQEYLDVMHKYHKKHMRKEINRITRKYGNYRIKKGMTVKMFFNEKEELKIRKSLTGKKLKEWEDESLKCFLSIVELNDLVSHEKSFFFSFLIFSFSEFEYALNNICYEFEQKNKSPIKLKDFYGKGVDRSINYLQKVCGFKMPDLELTNKILLIRDLRNCIIHSGGEIRNPQLLNKIKKHKLIKAIKEEIFDFKTVMFDEKFCKFATVTMYKYLVILCKNNPKLLFHWETSKI